MIAHLVSMWRFLPLWNIACSFDWPKETLKKLLRTLGTKIKAFYTHWKFKLMAVFQRAVFHLFWTWKEASTISKH